MLLSQPNMNQAATVYATKRRRRNGKSAKPQPVEANSKSNPSKRHRLRLNAELDTLASLLPYDQNILSKLDRLSILRLAVAYLRTKSFFQASMIVATKEEDVPGGESGVQYRRDGMLAYDASLSGETFIQALNGFLFILDCQGEVFFSTHNIESYLGFHQSDIIHQSVFELVHSEDREELQRQFMWNGFLTPDRAGMTQQEALLPENSHLLERSFTVRFRCLLDNTSGFLRLDIRGRIRALTGQSRHTEEPTLALFALCTPFGPPSLLDMPHKEVMFKSKHKLDLTMVSIDQRGKTLLGYDEEMHNQSGYALVHHDDLSYVASAHQELLKTGASGLIAYRLQTSDLGWQWLQTSSRLVYKNSKPDFVISTHRPLLEEEGRDLLGKRTMDFKVSYLDPGLSSQYLYDSEISSAGGVAATAAGAGGGSGSASNGKCSRRYKSQLRDFLTTCRTKRKLSADYSSSDATAAYGQYAAAGYPPAPSAYSADPSAIYNQQNFQSLYPSIDNRFLASDGLYYRQLGSYYPEYMHHGGYNGLVDVSRTGLGGYDASSQHRSGDYSPQIDVTKYSADRAYLPKSPYYDTYPSSAIINASLGTVPVGGSSGAVGGLGAGTAASSLQEGFGGGEAVEPAAEQDQRHTPERKPEIVLSPGAMKSVLTHTGAVSYNNPSDARQAVLMWGGSQVPPHGVTSHVVCSPSPVETVHYAAVAGHYSPVTPPCAERGAHVSAPVPHLDPIKCMGDMSAAACKWAPRMGSASPTSRTAHNQASYSELGHTEVWAPYSLGYHSPQTAEVYPSTTARNGTICCPSLR